MIKKIFEKGDILRNPRTNTDILIIDEKVGGYIYVDYTDYVHDRKTKKKTVNRIQTKKYIYLGHQYNLQIS